MLVVLQVPGEDGADVLGVGAFGTADGPEEVVHLRAGVVRREGALEGAVLGPELATLAQLVTDVPEDLHGASKGGGGVSHGVHASSLRRRDPYVQ